MASTASSSTFCNLKFHTKQNSNNNNKNIKNNCFSLPRIPLCQKKQHDNDHNPTNQINRRELILKSSELATIGAIFNLSGKKPEYLGVQKNPPSLALCPARSSMAMTTTAPTKSTEELILKSSELATIGAIFNLSGKKPEYLGVQKNPPSLALCPATSNCVSTSENTSDLTHYAPPWNYNPEGRKNPISKEEAIEELIEVIESTRPDKFTPKIVERKEDYVRVEYQSSILGFVNDVEFWFPPGKGSIVEYRSASRLGNFDFDVNRKRIKALRQELEKKGWASQETI